MTLLTERLRKWGKAICRWGSWTTRSTPSRLPPQCVQGRSSSSAPLAVGQVLLVGTDGVWEMPNAKGEQFGKDRLREVIRECAVFTADEIAQALRERLTAFRGAAK